MHWQTMDKAPLTGENVLVYTTAGGQDVIFLAFWCDGEHWEMQGFDSAEEIRGWWSYDNSVAQRKLEGLFEPRYWTEYHPPGQF